MSTLAANNLIKTYNKRNVVDGVALSVNTKEVVGLLWPNGAGKTTSFYMMVGLIKADEGTITLDSKDITHYPMHVRALNGIGYLPQEP
ncbi:MAG: ATP-binding cassette domain-containing protein, partial [Methylococcaceae bacterium]